MARILIIEDNASNVALMSYLLSAVGHRPEVSRDGQSGLDAARCQPPDLVLCDIQLPKLSGYQVAQALRADPALRSVPLVAVTALAMRGDSDKILAAGFDGYIAKPIQPEKLAEQVEAYLPAELRRGPRAAPVHPPAAPPPVPARPAREYTLLAVDDVASNLSLMRTIFASAGYRVLSARNMHEGLDLMRREAPDLVVSDVHMLSGDGFRFRRAAASEPALAGIPFIFVSSSVVTDRDRQEARELGIHDLLERPIDPRRLIDIAAACLQRRPGAT